MESYPKLHNEIGVPIVRVGCHEFECIGDKPPQDHPHIYLNMGDASEASVGARFCAPASHCLATKVYEQGIKILANATSYGIFLELNVEDYVTAKPMIGHGGRSETLRFKSKEFVQLHKAIDLLPQTRFEAIT
jgi:uncharacterized Zn-finger protein